MHRDNKDHTDPVQKTFLDIDNGSFVQAVSLCIIFFIICGLMYVEQRRTETKIAKAKDEGKSSAEGDQEEFKYRKI